MKRVTLFLLVIFTGFIAFSQGPGDLTEAQKLQMEFSKPAADADVPVFMKSGLSSFVPVAPQAVKPPLWQATDYAKAAPEWIHWDSGVNDDAIGTGAAADFMVAARFTPADLTEYAGTAITRIKFVPYVAVGTATYTLKIWQGTNPPTEVYSQAVSSVTIEAWNDIELNEAVDIDVSQELWVGYHVVTSSGYPAGCDAGPQVAGKGNMMYWQGVWQELTTIAPSLTYNWNIQAYVEVMAEPGAPGAPLNLVATPGAAGALSVSLSWNNPALTYDGQPLTDLDYVYVYRGAELIHTISAPSIGGAASYVDNGITAAGFVSYSVYGSNNTGDGPGAGATVYVGPDVPAAPSNVVLAAQGNDGYLTWTAPTAGLNGGYFEATGLSYTITRYPGAVLVASDITETSFLDNTIPNVGIYYYTVQAENAVGMGGIGTSNNTLLGAEGVVFMMNGEVTSCEGTFYDSGGPGGQYANSENFTLTFFPDPAVANAKMRFNFTAFNVEPSSTGCWDKLEVYDGPNTSAPMIGSFCGTTVPAALAELTSTHATGALTFHFTSDSSVPRDGWVADFYCYVPSSNDLRATAINGNVTPSVGAESIYNITVFNEGSTDQLGSAYTVELKDAAHNVLASVPGVDIESGEVIQVPVGWTPAADGELSIYGHVNFAGDDVPDNNSSPMLDVFVQPEGILAVTIGTAQTFPPSRMPWDFYWKNSISQTLYYPDEIGLGGGALTAIAYKNNFATNLPGKQVKIWMGETDAADLSAGWVDPATLTLVYDGPVDFPSGVNEIFIPLEVPYIYTGGNLVIYSLRVWEDAYFSSNDRFYGTEDAGSNRTRRAAADGTVYDPMAPPATATMVSWHPNTTLFFSTAGLGSLEGTVTDGTNPLEGVAVSVVGTMASTHTDATGFYEFPYLMPGTYDLAFDLFGYTPLLVEDVVVVAEEVTVQNAVMAAIPQYAVNGVVEGNDDAALVGAEIWMEGYEDYYMMAGTDGAFMFPEVYAGSYDVTINMPGYTVYTAVVNVTADLDLGTIVLTEILAAPYGVTIDPYNQGDGNALLSWNSAELVMLYQHDGAIPAEPNAFYQYQDRGYGVVYDLTAFPDAVVEALDFHHLQWGAPIATYPYLVHIINWETKTIIETVGPINTTVNDAWEEGVDLGAVNVAGVNQLAILIQAQGGSATDAYPDVTTDATGPNGVSLYAPMNDLNSFTIAGPTVGDFFMNLWISTAFAPDKVVQAQRLTAEQVETASRLGASLSSADATINNQTIVAPSEEKVFTGFNVYLDDMGTPVAQGIQETEYLFTELAEGSYTAGVSAVYTTGMSDIITVDFVIAMGVPVTVEVTTNGGDSAEGAMIHLANQVETQFEYSGMAGADGTLAFETIRKGMYTLTVTLEGYEVYVEEDIDIQDAATLEVELMEIIVPPYGLMVEETATAGEAHFSWNNITGLEEFIDSFEDGTFDAWLAFVQGPGTPGEGGNAYWHASDDPDGGTAPDGSYVAKADWGYNIDTWLISPLVSVSEGMGVTFDWYSSYYWSVSPYPNAELTIEVSTDGTNWTELWNWQNIGTWTNFTWYNTTVDLSAYVGQAVHVAVHLVGNDNAVSQVDNIIVTSATKFGTFALSKPVEVAEDARTLPAGLKAEKAFLGYNVYLDDMVTPVATSVAVTEFLFTGLANGDYVAGVQSVYTSGASEVVTIPFTITNGVQEDTYMVTFNVHMHEVEFEATDVIYITGSMLGWAVPGNDPDHQTMQATSDPNIFTRTLELEAGTYAYKYFMNAGWDNGEWAGNPDREVVVTGNMTVDDVFGNINNPVEVPVVDAGELLVYPNPARNVLNIASDQMIREVRIIDLLGQVVYASDVQGQRHEVNVGAFRNGIYFVQILTPKGLNTQRVQIAK